RATIVERSERHPEQRLLAGLERVRNHALPGRGLAHEHLERLLPDAQLGLSERLEDGLEIADVREVGEHAENIPCEIPRGAREALKQCTFRFGADTNQGV